MKKNTAIIWLIFLSVSSYAQVVSGIYSTREATWFGIDFTRAKMIGDFGEEASPDLIRDKYFRAWNNLMLIEKDKYNLPLFLHKQNILYSLETVTELNNAVDIENIQLPDEGVVAPFNLTLLQEILTHYAVESKKGVGVLMVVESFNKTKSVAILDLVFFDINTGQIYFAKRFSEKPKGVGIRNYWAKTVLLALEDASSSWETWSKEEKRKIK